MKQRENSTRAKSAKKMRPASGKKKKWVIIYRIINYLYFCILSINYNKDSTII
jgi:cell division septal protein FtsQ